MRAFFKLCLITALAVLVHGYHFGADDAEIYIPAIKRAANPLLYPFGDEFFMAHAHWSLFPAIVGESARITRLPVNAVIFVCYIAGVFLLLFACRQLAGACFANEYARWASVGLVAAVFSVQLQALR